MGENPRFSHPTGGQMVRCVFIALKRSLNNTPTWVLNIFNGIKTIFKRFANMIRMSPAHSPSYEWNNSHQYARFASKFSEINIVCNKWTSAPLSSMIYPPHHIQFLGKTMNVNVPFFGIYNSNTLLACNQFFESTWYGSHQIGARWHLSLFTSSWTACYTSKMKPDSSHIRWCVPYSR